ncbi:MAG: bifunctional DNA primase/polymerase [Candidatus Sulfotelmatobacter sp.]
MILTVHCRGLLLHALELHDLGFICVPLGRSGRHLDIRQMGYEPVHLKNRTKKLKELAFSSIAFHLCQQPPDAAAIEQWFANGASNLGILGGYRDLLVLDFDRPACFQRWQQRFGDLIRKTPVARALRGHHVYLRCSQPMPSSSLHYGFRRAGHVKALGGYITAPPSTGRDGTMYRWLDGQSPHDLKPQPIDSLESLSLGPVSPFKSHYDRLLKRGSFSDDCASQAALPAMQH